MNIIYKEKEKLFIELVEKGNLSVSEDGIVINNITKRELGSINNYGYKYIGYKIEGKTYLIYVHRLVYLLYGGVFTKEKPIINHIDGNKLNNHISNLEAVSWSYNNKHAFNIGLRVQTEELSLRQSKRQSGDNNNFAKLSNAQAREIRNKYETGEYTFTALGKEYSVDRHAISDIVKFRTFKYID